MALPTNAQSYTSLAGQKMVKLTSLPMTMDLGVEKPAVENWTDVTYEQMRHRCESDVKINWLLWQRMKKRLEEIYES